MAVLSIQSHVAYGRVGNRAAVFALERMGLDVWPINTVQLSNHRGYPSCAGEAYSAAQLRLVWSGIKDRGVLGSCEAVLSGYLSSAEIGAFALEAALDVKSANPSALYCLDPVMGDFGKGLYVEDAIPSFMRSFALGWSDIVTPNHFEAELLCERAIEDLDGAKRACDELRRKGPSIVLITSFEPKGSMPGRVSMLLASDYGFHSIETPLLEADPPLRGTGDLCAALFLGRYLLKRDPVLALEEACSSLFEVLELTMGKGGGELRLVEAQAAFAGDERRFRAAEV